MLKKKFFIIILILIFLASSILTKLILTKVSDIQAKKIFLDVTDKSGIQVKATNLGISWGDYDNDGYDDMFVSNMDSPSKLFRNLRNGKFEDVTAKVGIKDHMASSAVFADVDNDGQLDLLIVSFDKQINKLKKDSKNGLEKTRDSFRTLHLVLYKNLGFRGFEKGVFTNETASVGLDSVKIEGRGTVSFSDIDNDGWLDFLLSSYGDEGYYTYPFQASPESTPNKENLTYLITQIEGKKPTVVFAKDKNKDNISKVEAHFPGETMLFQNTGKGKFINISSKLSKLDTSSRAFFQPVFFDYDGDGFADLFLAVDWDHSFMLKNTGKFKFVDVTKGDLLKKGDWMGADVSDFNNDGRLDLYITNIGGDLLAEGLDQEFKIKTILNRQSIGWGVSFMDYDNDGWQDIFACSGDTGPRSKPETFWKDFTRENKLYKNKELEFVKIEGEVNDNQACKGVASSDFDNNGFPDIFVANETLPNGKGSLLYKNTGNANSWLKIKLKGTKSNKFGVGAKIQVTEGNIIQTKVVTAGNSFYSQGSYEQIFGFGNFRGKVNITVFWPSGKVSRLENIKLNQRLTIDE